MKRATSVWIAIATAALLATPSGSGERLEMPSVATLPDLGDHWIWVPDRLLRHSLLFDGDSGEALGMLDSGAVLAPRPPLLSRSRQEFYVSDTAYSRGSHGERSDFVSIWDARTLGYKGEIIVPTRVGESNASLQYAEILGERFMGVFNQFPNTSVSIVDLEQRRFVEEIIVTGCAGVFPVSERRFATLCGDGTTLAIDLDASGRKSGSAHSERFFDVVEDPAFMAAGRDATRWTFVTFLGRAQTVDFGARQPTLGPVWWLTSESERQAGWRPGGLQHVAVHGGKQRLYVVMHQGQAGSHKSDGREIWVYDLSQRERVGRFGLPNLTAAFLGPQMGIEPGSLSERALQLLLPSAGVHSIVVTQDANPLLFARNSELGAVAVLDALTGETLRVLYEAGLAGPTLRVP